jgi:4-hydroxy-tetrahydrodipicolinate reductase
MNVLLIGYGKMGKLLEARLFEKKHAITAVVDPFAKGGASVSGAEIYPSVKEFVDAGHAVDVAIDFTRPDSAPANITACAEHRIPLVVGTTGWYDKLPLLTEKVNKEGSALLWASNFSLGVNLFYKVAEYAAQLFDSYAEYDAAGYEIHHNKKADSPSGTAKTLAEKVLALSSRKKRVVYDKLDRPPLADELHFASLRVGATPGVHALVFDSAADTVEIKHTARNREGLAAGAIIAAEWLVKEPRKGVFTFDDVLKK